MNQYYSIQGGRRLEGTVTISGAKNAAVAIIPAAILAGECCILENLPAIQDVQTLKHILSRMGAQVDFTRGDCMRVDPTHISTVDATFPEISAMRASYYLLGAMLGAYGEVELALPGGCVIGPRPIDQHIKGLRALGANVYIDESRNVVRAQASKLHGAEIFFDLVSVGATINLMLAACKAEGQTVLQNVAKEPHVVDVANFLNMMGASIKGAGTDVIRIQGRKKLHGCSYAVIPDQIETGTYMIAAAATRGDVIIKNVIPTHMEAITAKLLESGAQIVEGDDGREFYLRVKMDGRPRGVNIKTAVYPGFPTDLQPVQPREGAPQDGRFHQRQQAHRPGPGGGEPAGRGHPRHRPEGRGRADRGRALRHRRDQGPGHRVHRPGLRAPGAQVQRPGRQHHQDRGRIKVRTLS